jgi:hypothetical protein
MTTPAWTKPVGAAAGLAAAGALVAVVPPNGQPFYPPCPLHALTGWWCPVCGATRAVHAILTGHPVTAVHDNVLFLVVTPVVAYLWLSWLLRTTGRAPLPRPAWPRWATVVCVAVAVTFGVARNVPTRPFTTLAPVATVRQ